MSVILKGERNIDDVFDNVEYSNPITLSLRQYTKGSEITSDGIKNTIASIGGDYNLILKLKRQGTSPYLTYQITVEFFNYNPEIKGQVTRSGDSFTWKTSPGSLAIGSFEGTTLSIYKIGVGYRLNVSMVLTYRVPVIIVSAELNLFPSRKFDQPSVSSFHLCKQVRVRASLDFFGNNVGQVIMISNKYYSQYLPKIESYIVNLTNQSQCETTFAAKVLAIVTRDYERAQIYDVTDSILKYAITKYFLWHEIFGYFTLEILKKRYNSLFLEALSNNKDYQCWIAIFTSPKYLKIGQYFIE